MADVSTEVAIATQTLGSSAASITFSSIPSTYTDLRLVLNAQDSSTGGNALLLRFNSDTASNYSLTTIYGDGASAISNQATSQTFERLTITGMPASPLFSLYTVDIFSYAGSTYKTSLITSSEDNNGSGMVGRRVGLWRLTSAITSISITGGTNINTSTTATLYGIL